MFALRKSSVVTIILCSVTLLLSGCSQSDDSDPISTIKSLIRVMTASGGDELKGDVDIYKPTSADFDRLNKKVLANPNNASIFRNRGRAFYYSDLPDRLKLALIDYNKALSLFPWNAHWYSERSDLFKNLEQYEEALKDIDKAIQLDGSNSLFYSERASIYDDLGRDEEAYLDHARAAKNERPVGQYSMQLARELAKRGQEKEALELLNSIASQIDDYWRADVYDERLNIFISQGKFDLAKHEIDEWKKAMPENSTVYQRSAKLIELLHPKEKSMADYQQLVKISNSVIEDPEYKEDKHADDYGSRADYLEKIDQPKKAAEDRRMALALYNAEAKADPIKDDASLSIRAELLRKLGEHKKAEELNSRELKLTNNQIAKVPNDYEGYHSRALLLEGHGKYEQALRDYARAKELKPRDNHLIGHHADCLNHLKRYREAFDECQTGLGETRRHHELLLCPLAEACEQLGKHKEAVEYATTKINLDRTSGDAYHWRSRAYLALGKTEPAAKDTLLSRWFASEFNE